MKKSIKAIVAAAAASVMCAAPAVTPIANVSTTAITASAATALYDANGNPTASFYSVSGRPACYVTNNSGLIYQITANTRNKHEVQFCGVASTQSSVVVDNKININGAVFNVTGIAPDAFRNAPDSTLRNFDLRNAVQITSIAPFTFASSSIESILLHDHFTEIGLSAFFNADRIQTIDIPADVTNICAFAFASCDNLKTVRFVENDDAELTIGDSAFKSCTSLKKIINNRDISEDSETSAFDTCSQNIKVRTEYPFEEYFERYVVSFCDFFGFNTAI